MIFVENFLKAIGFANKYLLKTITINYFIVATASYIRLVESILNITTEAYDSTGDWFKNKYMKNKILFAMLLTLAGTVAKAQNNDHKMSDTQKEQAAKADVFIINSKKKVIDSFTIAGKDSVTIVKKSKNRSCCSKRNKKSS